MKKKIPSVPEAPKESDKIGAWRPRPLLIASGEDQHSLHPPAGNVDSLFLCLLSCASGPVRLFIGRLEPLGQHERRQEEQKQAGTKIMGLLSRLSSVCFLQSFA